MLRKDKVLEKIKAMEQENTDQPEMQLVYNVRDIMTLFNVKRHTVYKWRKAGLLQMYKIGGLLFAKRADVFKLLEDDGKEV